MLILRAGLYVAVALGVYTTWASSSAGYPIETAMLRGLLAFMAGSFVSYLAELVVMTAPVPQRRAQAAPAGPRDDGDVDEEEPVTLPATRSGRDAAADERRAA
jgi:hypothetical protein